jgi:hypothetical protein
MNRRSFITGIIAACVAPRILPAAKTGARGWRCNNALWVPELHPYQKRILESKGRIVLDRGSRMSGKADFEAQCAFVKFLFLRDTNSRPLGPR